MSPFGYSSLRVSLFWFLVFSLASLPVFAQQDPELAGSTLIDIGDVRVHYLDFGGDGLPVLFIHGVERGAETWAGFAPRFTEHHRVLAMTARGVGESEGAQGDTAIRAGDLLSFLDAMTIDRVVLVGNSGPGLDMTFLAEHHPNRIAGLVYLANAPPDSRLEEIDPSGGLAMAARATGQSMDDDPYEPRFVGLPDDRIDIPALTFVSASGDRGWENMPFPLMVVRRATAMGTDWIEDAEARAFFQRAVEDESVRQEMRKAWIDAVVPAAQSREQSFRAAFGDRLNVVALDLPFVTGYEYLNAPEMIEPSLHDFLVEVRRREGAR